MIIEKGSSEGLAVYAHVKGMFGGGGTVKQKLSDEELKQLGFRHIPINSYPYAEFVAKKIVGKNLNNPNIVYKNSRQRRLEKKRRRLRGAYMKITMKGLDVDETPRIRNELVKEILKVNEVKSVKHIKKDEVMFEVIPRMTDQQNVNKILNDILDIEMDHPKGKKKFHPIQAGADYNCEFAD